MAEQRPFPRSEEDFKDDERISYDTQSSKWTLENEDGKEYEWHERFRSWVEIVRQSINITRHDPRLTIFPLNTQVDTALIQAQQAAYAGEHPESVITGQAQDSAQNTRKRETDEKVPSPLQLKM